ncbi:MAG: hypothetical protein UY36_C0018G0007, partial [Parcubacteria group bacterium GW2011_GWA1_49_11]
NGHHHNRGDVIRELHPVNPDRIRPLLPRRAIGIWRVDGLVLRPLHVRLAPDEEGDRAVRQRDHERVIGKRRLRLVVDSSIILRYSSVHGPIVYRLGHSLLKAGSGVRFSVGS